MEINKFEQQLYKQYYATLEPTKKKAKTDSKVSLDAVGNVDLNS